MSDTWTNVITRLGLLGLAKGATAAAQATVTTVDADHNALDVTVKGTPALAADAATATLQGTGNGFLQTLAGIVSAGRAAVTEASAASILAKLSSDPSTATLQTTGNTSLAAILAKIIAAPATEAKQDAGNTSAATTATQTTTTATNTGTLAGVVNSGAAITKQKAGTAYNSAALEKSAVVSASACSPAMARMWNAGGSTRFLQGHDANALPANGAIPDDVVSVGTAAATVPIVWPIPSNGYANGFVAACSTTAATLTITGTNDALFSIILFPSGS